MNLINFDGLSVSLLLLIFAAAASLVWFAGTRLSRYANALAEKTGTADVVIGTLLLGGVTSLPELVTTITASTSGNPGMSVNNLFGGVALQVAILAIGDAVVKKRSITSLIGSPVVQLQALVGILLLVTAACFILVGDYSLMNIGLGSILILIFFAGGFYLINYFQAIHWWRSDPEARDSIGKVREAVASEMATEREDAEREEERERRQSFASILKTRLFLYLALSALAIMLAGYTVVRTGEVISTKTGLSSGVMGAVFIALATSLPEISTTVASVRMKEYRLAFSNIFGTNIFDLGIVFVADVFYSKGPILNEVDKFSVFGALLGAIVTTIYLIGLTVRFKKTFLNLGYDSYMVIIGYLAGVTIMFTLLKP